MAREAGQTINQSINGGRESFQKKKIIAFTRRKKVCQAGKDNRLTLNVESKKCYYLYEEGTEPPPSSWS